MTLEQIRQRLYRMGEGRLTMLAKDAGISKRGLYQIMGGVNKPDNEILGKLMREIRKGEENWVDRKLRKERERERGVTKNAGVWDKPFAFEKKAAIHI